MKIDLTDKVAIVTGAGRGLGREHALALAARGARVVVNDIGGSVDGAGTSEDAAASVVREITGAGCEAMASAASVTDYTQVEQMVAEAEERWGRVDILVANAGILRDRTFAKMDLADFRAVLDVHVMGTVNCAKAVWEGMRARAYGRLIFTSSSSGLFGAFGQSNYGAAKMAIVGLMNTLALEGAKYGIRVNCLAPTAGTRMLEGLMPEAKLAALAPRFVSPAVVALASEEAPTKTVLCAGAGSFETAQIALTQGGHFGDGETTAEAILRQMENLTDMTSHMIPENGAVQGTHELRLAGFEEEMA